MSDRAVHLVIAGRVQGVGFRAYVEDEAVRRGVRGWVRNREEGNVEAVLNGPEAALEEMVEACWRGPAGACVTAVDVGAASETLQREGGHKAGFTVLPTL